MNAEIFAALAQLEKERGIPQSYMVEKITQALVAAYKKDKDGYTDNVFVEVKDNDMHMYVQKEVVDDVITPATEITLDAARRISKTAQLGDLVNVDVQTKDFGRIAAQTAKQVIIQGIREAERGMVFDTFSSKEHEILTGTVLRIEPAPLACLAPLRVATGLPAPFRRSPGWLPSPLGWRPSMALQTRQKRRRSRVRDTAAAGVVDTSRKTWPSLTDEGRTLTLEGPTHPARR